MSQWEMSPPPTNLINLEINQKNKVKKSLPHVASQTVEVGLANQEVLPLLWCYLCPVRTTKVYSSVVYETTTICCRAAVAQAVECASTATNNLLSFSVGGGY